jgi:hypothetical protein
LWQNVHSRNVNGSYENGHSLPRNNENTTANTQTSEELHIALDHGGHCAAVHNSTQTCLKDMSPGSQGYGPRANGKEEFDVD